MSKYTLIRSKKLRLSFLIDKKTFLLTVMLAFAALCAFVISLGVGTLRIHPVDTVKTLLGFGPDQYSVVIRTFRLPRVIVAMLVGICLAVSGAMLQGMIRNPLASPDIIGITGGASAAAVAFIICFPQAGIQWLPAAAFAGAALVTLVVYVLAWKQGVAPLRLVLIGVGIGAAMAAVTTLLIVMAPIELTSKAMIWLTGTVYGANWSDVSALAVWTAVFVPLAFVFGRSINAQQLGDDIAAGIGNPVQRHRFLLLFICAALAGSAVAIGGAIGFVALIAPHIAKKLTGPAFGGLLPVSALTGALIVMLADLVGRTAFAPLDLPVGIFTSAIGAPFFIYLLYRNRNQ